MKLKLKDVFLHVVQRQQLRQTFVSAELLTPRVSASASGFLCKAGANFQH